MKNVLFLLIFIGILSNSFGQFNLHLYDYKCFGGSNIDAIHSVLPVGDSLIAIIGYTYSSDGDFESAETSKSGYIMFIDTSLNFKKKIIFGGENSESAINSVITPDNTFLIAYNSNSNTGEYSGAYGDFDIYIKNYDYTADWLSQYLRFGGSGEDKVFGLSKKNMGGYLISGKTNSTNGDFTINSGEFDGFVINLTPTYTKAWAKTFGGSDDDYIIKSFQLQDGNIIIFGCTLSNDSYLNSNHGNYDVWIAKLNSMGDLIWSKCLGGSLNDYLFSIFKIDNDRFVITGYSNSIDGDFVFVAKNNDNQRVSHYFGFICVIDSNGDIISGTSIGFANSDTYITSANVINDLEFEIFGTVTTPTTSNPLYAYFNNSFLPDYENIIDWITTEDVYNCNINGINYTVMPTNTAELPGFHGNVDVLVLKSKLHDIGHNFTEIIKRINIHPNPVNDKIFMENSNYYDGCEYNIMTINGELLLSGKISSNYIAVDILQPGNYFLSIKKDQIIYFEKFLKIK
ncbi:MAG: T9SS type A sorting domain-containing protein [Bacteroidales bacterium]|jgi:hypothetical protein